MTRLKDISITAVVPVHNEQDNAINLSKETQVADHKPHNPLIYQEKNLQKSPFFEPSGSLLAQNPLLSSEQKLEYHRVLYGYCKSA